MKTCKTCKKELPLENFRKRTAKGRKPWIVAHCRKCENRQTHRHRDGTNPRCRWVKQKAHAKARGIEFLLTFEEWWDLWKDKYHLRGKGADQYCMARFGDCGPYSVDNVAIVTTSENVRRLI